MRIKRCLASSDNLVAIKFSSARLALSGDRLQGFVQPGAWRPKSLAISNPTRQRFEIAAAQITALSVAISTLLPRM